MSSWLNNKNNCNIIQNPELHFTILGILITFSNLLKIVKNRFYSQINQYIFFYGYMAVNTW